MIVMAEDARVEITSVADLQAWLAQNHASAASIWLITWKAHHPDRYVPYRAIVEEAIAWGWIDSLPRALDGDRSMRRLSPRKPASAWSAVNKAIAEALIAAGRMQPPGLAAIVAAKANGAWTRLDAVERGVIPDDLVQALAAHPPAADHFAAFPRSTRRAILEWIGNARTPETRARRVAETALQAAQNLRANQPRGPKHLARPGT